MNGLSHPLRAATLAGLAIMAGCNQSPAAPTAARTASPTEVVKPAPPSPPPTPPEVPAKPVLAVDGEGLRLFDPNTGSASPIPFGRPKADVLPLLERLRGPAKVGINQDCGAGPVEFASWPDGLGVVFQNDRFAGWALSASTTISTASGIGPGATREQLDAAYADVRVIKTTLGDEFTTGGFAGLLDGPNASSKITDLWAGANCVAR